MKKKFKVIKCGTRDSKAEAVSPSPSTPEKRKPPNVSIGASGRHSKKEDYHFVMKELKRIYSFGWGPVAHAIGKLILTMGEELPIEAEDKPTKRGGNNARIKEKKPSTQAERERGKSGNKN